LAYLSKRIFAALLLITAGLPAHLPAQTAHEIPFTPVSCFRKFNHRRFVRSKGPLSELQQPFGVATEDLLAVFF
jgi:hypothetical protein